MTNDTVYLLRNDVALESFDDEALLFQAADCTLLRINRLAREVLMRLDGGTDVDTICGEIAEEYGELPDRVLADVSAMLEEFERDRFLKRRHDLPLTYGSSEMNEETRYMVNPDVSCRIEDEDGAILYNPDTDGVQVINPMGLEIWETLSEPRTLAALVTHIRDVCEDAPEGEVGKDVEEFVKPMVEKGFIGVVEEEGH